MMGFLLGDRVVVTIDNQKTYAGEVSFVNESFDRMEIRKPYHIISGTRHNILNLRKNDISSIALLKCNLKNVREVPICHFTLTELIIVGQAINNYVFIDMFDVKYHRAIEDIASHSNVGLYIAGAEMGRFTDTSLIVISTVSSIYIFDIKSMGRIEKALKNILETKSPKKIIHDASKVADNLKNRYNVNLNGVFDTMIAHCSLGFDKKRSSLRECLIDHFNVPCEFLESSSTYECQKRPVNPVQLIIAAKCVVFLRKFYIYFLNIMVKDDL